MWKSWDFFMGMISKTKKISKESQLLSEEGIAIYILVKFII